MTKLEETSIRNVQELKEYTANEHAEEQAAVVEENEKQTEAIAGKIKESLNGKLNGVLGVSIAALLVAAADIVLHVLNILHIF